jgi:hypothetical protein
VPLQDYVPSEHEEPSSPPRPNAASRARAMAAASLSPATQAAVTMATLLATTGQGAGGLPPVLPAVVGPPPAPVKQEGGAAGDDPDAAEGLSTRATVRRQPPGESIGPFL